MRFLATSLALLLAFVPCAFGQGDSVLFKRAFKAYEAGVYSISFADMGQPPKVTTDIAYSVTKLEGDVATVAYNTLAILNNGKLDKGDQPKLTSKVEPNGMATDLTAATPSDILFLILDAAGITPNASVDTKHAVPIHWQNVAKNFTLDGSGTVTANDLAGKTLTVDWIMKFTTPGVPDGQFKLTSVYSTDDFSLKSSKGTLALGNDPMFSVVISRAESKETKPTSSP